VDPSVRTCYWLDHFLLLVGPHGEGFQGQLAEGSMLPMVQRAPSDSAGASAGAGGAGSSSDEAGVGPVDFRVPWVPDHHSYAEQLRGKGFRELPDQFERSNDMECCPISPHNDTVLWNKCYFYNVYQTNYTAQALGAGQQQVQLQTDMAQAQQESPQRLGEGRVEERGPARFAGQQSQQQVEQQQRKRSRRLKGLMAAAASGAAR
jgi:hypothetical protein